MTTIATYVQFKGSQSSVDDRKFHTINSHNRLSINSFLMKYCVVHSSSLNDNVLCVTKPLERAPTPCLVAMKRKFGKFRT